MKPTRTILFRVIQALENNQNRTLLAVVDKVVSRTLLPSIPARFMPLLVIGTTKRKSVLDPKEVLFRHPTRNIVNSLSEVHHFA